MPDIIIYNHNIGKWDSFDEPDEAFLCLDRLINKPCKELIDEYKIKSKMEYLHLILPHIAKLFDVDRWKLVEIWVEKEGIWECFKG
ncbi:hypothetical protein LCGC14_1451480 [marine sediment metagenome]|uniref:Uncharacterized protein n=1 Tax=marine sediment metagenome TaxID=412755 RepID=A0A0F9JII2_9ZZZZ